MVPASHYTIAGGCHIVVVATGLAVAGLNVKLSLGASEAADCINVLARQDQPSSCRTAAGNLPAQGQTRCSLASQYMIN
jgi:hypothetical protein